MSKKELVRRYLVFSGALFVSALGVSMITRSYLGTSPISSIPFVFSLNTALTMGSYIFILNMVLIALQMLMLGGKGIRERKIDLLMQIPVSVLFGLFIDATMWLLSFMSDGFYPLQIVSLIIGCAILALGICLEVVADVTMVSGEYTVQIASKRFNKEFGSVKIMFDVSLVVLAVLSSWLFAGRIDGIREGTIIAALATGPFVRIFLPHLNFIRRWQAIDAPVEQENIIPAVAHPIITISREYGSGGHLIGKMVAKQLNIPFYDTELIDMVAKEGDFTHEFVSEKEQSISNSLLFEMIMQDYEAPLEKSLSRDDALFVAQSRVIRRVAAQGPCVIVGRCADYILKDFPNVINIFVHANLEYKIERAVVEYGISKDKVADEIRRIDHSRSEHCYHYTGMRWGESRNYHITCDTSKFSLKQIGAMIEVLYAQSSVSE